MLPQVPSFPLAATILLAPLIPQAKFTPPTPPTVIQPITRIDMTISQATLIYQKMSFPLAAMILSSPLTSLAKSIPRPAPTLIAPLFTRIDTTISQATLIC